MLTSVPQNTFLKVTVTSISPGRFGSSNLSVWRKKRSMKAPLSSNLGLRRLQLIKHSRPVPSDFRPESDVQAVEAVGRDDSDGQAQQLLFAEVISRPGIHLVGHVAVGDARHGLRPF